MDSFSTTYFEARQKFLSIASKLNSEIKSYKNPNIGPDNKELFTDVAYIGPKNPKELLITISGLHGVEAFCGSSFQIDYLTNHYDRDIAVLFIHAINPWGFAYLHRENEDNIDLNRNFINHEAKHPINKAYDQIASALVPEKWFSEEKIKADEFLFNLEKKDEKTYKKTLYMGQYHHPEGLFFGGNKPAWSNIIFHQILQEFAFHIPNIALVDFHSGYGKYGQVELYTQLEESSLEHHKLLKYFDDILIVKKDPYPVLGALIQRAKEFLTRSTIISMVIEYGTCTPSALDCLRADKWLLDYGDLFSSYAQGIKKELKTAVCPDDLKWRDSACNTAKKVLNKTIEYLKETSG